MLVDTADIASGATSASSRLIHGGLRYLEFGEFDLVRESLAERERLLALAPQFVKPLRLFIPIERRWGGLFASIGRFLSRGGGSTKKRRPRGLWLVRLGLRLYDRFARGTRLPKRGVYLVGQGDLPPVDPKRFRWLCSYYDAQVAYAERLVVAILDDARSIAAENGTPFQVFTYHRAKRLDGRVTVFPVSGADATQTAAAEFEPAAIVNATGAWVDHTLAKLAIDSRRLIGGTKGSHFITSHAGLRKAIGDGGLYAEAEDGRPFFILPLGDSVLVGTTDLPFEDSPESAVATDEELGYLLAGVERVFPQIELMRGDIDFHYSGVRPLPFVDKRQPSAITRRHFLHEHEGESPPLFSVIGGKLTTCRSLAEETATTVLARLGKTPVSASRERPLPGGEAYPTDAAALAAAQTAIAEATGCSAEQVYAVWPLAGTRSDAMLLNRDRSTFSAADRESVTGTNLPRGFVRRVIEEEWVAHLSDLIERRLMLLYQSPLRTETLRELADMLVAAGRMEPSSIDSEVDATIARLNTHYGKRVT